MLSPIPPERVEGSWVSVGLPYPGPPCLSGSYCTSASSITGIGRVAGALKSPKEELRLPRLPPSANPPEAPILTCVP